jgi:hypothetical protein
VVASIDSKNTKEQKIAKKPIGVIFMGVKAVWLKIPEMA